MIAKEDYKTRLQKYNEVVSDLLETNVLKKDHLSLITLNKRGAFEYLLDRRANTEAEITHLMKLVNTIRSRRTYLSKKQRNLKQE